MRSLYVIRLLTGLTAALVIGAPAFGDGSTTASRWGLGLGALLVALALIDRARTAGSSGSLAGCTALWVLATGLSPEFAFGAAPSAPLGPVMAIVTQYGPWLPPLLISVVVAFWMRAPAETDDPPRDLQVAYALAALCVGHGTVVAVCLLAVSPVLPSGLLIPLLAPLAALYANALAVLGLAGPYAPAIIAVVLALALGHTRLRARAELIAMRDQNQPM
ncbi:MAG: hypothetical protein AAGF59_10295 [Pseudomonadota bacterium]